MSEIATVKERPLLMNGEMVRAVLDCRKTQTRRIVKPQPPEWINELHGGELSQRAPYAIEDDEQRVFGWGFQDDHDRYYKFPYGSIGDRLWVRETVKRAGAGACWFAADNSLVYGTDKLTGKRMAAHYQYKRDVLPSIHMPRDWSRITLEITEVRVERLRDISEEDAIAEGVVFGTGKPGECRTCAKGAFMDLWNSINGTDAWLKNPWVWVMAFKKVTQ